MHVVVSARTLVVLDDLGLQRSLPARDFDRQVVCDKKSPSRHKIDAVERC